MAYELICLSLMPNTAHTVCRMRAVHPILQSKSLNVRTSVFEEPLIT